MELGTVGASLGTCRPPWLLSSSEPAAIRFRPVREVAIAMTREDRCSYRVEAARAKEHAAPARRHDRQRTCGGAGDRRSESRGRSCSRSGKGRLHRQSPSCQKTVGSETFLPSAVVQRSCKILGAAADRTTNTARRPLCPNLQQ